VHFLLFVFLVGLGAVAASAAVCAAYGWRGKVLLHGRPFQYGIVMIGVPSLLIGSVAFAATDRAEGRAIAVALAALPGILFLRRGQGRAARLTRPTADTVLEVVAGLRRSRPPAGTTSMAFEVSVLSDAQKLVVARRFDAAAEILGLLEWDLLEGLVLIQAALLLSRCYVESNLFNQGRETLERARETLVKDGGAEEKADYALLDARFVVHGERPNELGGQLATLEKLAKRQPRLAAEVRVVHLHWLVASGKTDEAIARFGELRLAYGDAATEMMARPIGPATALVAELTRTTAYR